MRLDKYLANSGAGSRKEVKQLIQKGRVSVNGLIIKDPGYILSEGDSRVTVDGESIIYEEYSYYMMNKPAGVITATEDKREKTVLDLMPPSVPKGLSPVGRLDKDTVGLLLLTNDGELAHRLLSPKTHVPKTYFAIVCGTDRHVDDSDIEAFFRGIELSDFTCKPAKLNVLKKKEGFVTETLVTIYEGKFHQIKRMFKAIGFEVIFLKRESMGPLSLDEKLSPGEFRRLSSEEINKLKS